MLAGQEACAGVRRPTNISPNETIGLGGLHIDCVNFAMDTAGCPYDVEKAQGSGCYQAWRSANDLPEAARPFYQLAGMPMRPLTLTHDRANLGS